MKKIGRALGKAWGKIKKLLKLNKPLVVEGYVYLDNIFLENPMTWNAVVFDANGLIKDNATPPVAGGTLVVTGEPSLSLLYSSGNLVVGSPTLSVSQSIPNIILTENSTHDMSQYITDPLNIRTNTWMSDLSVYASYDPQTELLTAVQPDTVFGVRLFVTDEPVVDLIQGTVEFYVDAQSDFDVYTSSPTTQEQQWMRDNYTRMQTYSPYFDSRTSWFPNAWVYKDSYAIKPEWQVFTDHPEWVLRDGANNMLYIPWGCSGGTCPQFAGDFGNPDFQAWWIAEATALLAQGYKGIWVDDVNLEWRVSDGNGDFVNPIDPRTGVAMTLSNYRRYFAEFMELIRSTFPTVELAHNSIWFATDPTDQYILRQIDACDYINIERGVTDSGITGGSGTFGFETFLAFIDRVHSRGKNVVMDDKNSITNADWRYELAFYFLIKETGDMLGADGDRSRMSPNNLDPIYSTDLGTVSGNRYLWNNLYRRNYAGGFVLVNPPGAATVNANLPQTYSDLDGNPVSAVSLVAGSGTVLIDNVVP